MNDRYQVGGSLRSNALSYVERQCDQELYSALKNGEFCYVLNSRQMGKSSLLVKTSYYLRQEGFKCTLVDLTNIGSENITPLQWYKGLITDLLSGLNLSPKVNLKLWWQEQDDFSLLQKLSRFISEVLLVEFPHEQIIIFIDEIDNILTLNFPVDDFFALIRYCYNQRAVNPEYHRITFAIFGVATPSNLIQDKRRTPFNIGKSIQLEGFTLDKIQPLADGLIIENGNVQEIMTQILKWTNGQPFLTHKLCQIIFELSQSGDVICSSSGQEANVVENIVKKYIIDKWEFQDEPQHLRTIQDRILISEHSSARNLEIYQRILSGEDVPSNSPEKIELLLSGLVVNSQGKLKVKNLIYEAVFNDEWILTQMGNLRPYAQNIQFWIASGQKDTLYLLRDTALKTALAWSYNKKLSDQDYRFLTASQELVKQEIENDLVAEKLARQVEREKADFALASARIAQQFLVQARKTAKIHGQSLRVGKRSIMLVTLFVACAVITLRSTGLLQGMEWTMLDRFFQARPPAPVDSRIVVVAIDESHIQQIGRYPMSDMVLAKALQILKSYKPNAIGLDLYRDLPVEPGSQELAQLYQTTPNLIGVEKAVGNTIAPPPILAELEQIGLADQVLDGDGKVRRALLSVRRQNNLTLNLGLKLALSYLKTQGITPQNLPNNQIQIGKARLVPFESDDGGYVRADAGGYQILLNYHGAEKQFQTISFMDVLSKRVPPELVQNRVVLIGATAESANDLFQTPYSSRIFDNPQQMPGVYLHANVASQILSAALNRRPMLQVWFRGVEWLWIILWSGAGTLFSWYFKSLKHLVVVIALTIFTLMTITYLAFLLGWWIPVVPPLIGLVVAAVSLPIVIIKQLERIQLSQTVKLLLALTEEQPTAGQIAIEYLKQAESQENQELIEKILRSKKS